MTAAEPAPSTWAPLRIALFRAMWIAALVSNIGTWMQTVGAQWLLVNGPNAALLVALVQVSDMVPDLVFGLVGGVLADTFDRRRLLIVVQTGLVATGAVLTILTYTHQMPPALLLTFTFLLGFGSVLTTPAFQSLVPDLVPRAQIGAAAALSAISINIARAAGPALAGLLIAHAGVGAVFAFNTASFAVFGLVILAWRPAAGAEPKHPEQFLSAMRAGGRYIRYSFVVRRILLRAALFLVPASALWALLPLVASERLHLGADGYGLMLGALGAGAVAGALVLPRILARWGAGTRIVVASVVYAAAMAGVVLIGLPLVALLILIPGGMAWMAILTFFNAELQLFLPAWVRARGLSVYQMVFFGAQALGAVVWGAIAGPVGLVPTFLVATAVLMAGAMTIRLWPLIDTAGMNRDTVAYWDAPKVSIGIDPEAGPVAVRTAYRVTAEKEAAFIKAMALVRRSRLRTGATRWGLYRDAERPELLIEFFVVPSWEEHLRQHNDRLTGVDKQFEEQAEALAEAPPQTAHLIAVDVGE